MDITRIHKVVERMNAIGKRDLRNNSLLEDLIRSWGLHDDYAVDFGEINNPYRVSMGMIQQPEQLSKALIFLSNLKIDSFIEIGTFSGSDFTFISLYLRKFNPLIKTISVDIEDRFDGNLFELIRDFSIKHVGTSNDFKGSKYDLCFIDADHKYESVKKDYENVGQYANICMFHDINDEGTVKERDGGGSVKFWNEIKKGDCYEFKMHPEGKNIMGIGIKL